MDAGRGWYSRGYLPHIDVAEKTQFLTWRLADALPASLLSTWGEKFQQMEDRERHNEIARRIES